VRFYILYVEADSSYRVGSLDYLGLFVETPDKTIDEHIEEIETRLKRSVECVEVQNLNTDLLE
jgi:hypothetical protein